MYPLEQTDVNAYDFCELFYYFCKLNQKYLEEIGAMTEVFQLYMDGGIQKKLHRVLDKIKTIDNSISFNAEYLALWNSVVANFHPDVKAVLEVNELYCLDDACEALHKLIAKTRVEKHRGVLSSAQTDVLSYQISELTNIYQRTVIDFELLRNLLVNKAARVREFQTQRTILTPTQFDTNLKIQYDTVKRNLYRIREYHNNKLAEYNINFFAQTYKRQEQLFKSLSTKEASKNASQC